MTRLLTLMSACAALGALAACGAKVVVDTGSTSGPDGTGGIASSGGTAGSNGTGMNGVGGGSCLNPPDPSTLTFCGGAGSGAGGSGGTFCENDFCDMHGNTWAAVCSGSTCQCKFNDVVVCTCALNEPGDICAGTPACCPLPTL